MPTEIVQLLGYDGPNLHGPQPGVFLKVRSDKDRGQQLREMLKDGAQRTGMVLGYLETQTERAGEHYVISASFATPTSALGVALARHAVEGLNRAAAGDEAWDDEGPLWDLQKRRRAEALPLQALQLTAEAAARGIPSFRRADGQLQLGYGARGWAFDPARLQNRSSTAEPIDVPWERLGPIPIVALAGGAGCDVAAGLIAATLHQQGQAVGLATAAGFDATRALLADPSAAIAVAALTAEELARRGLAFARCAYSAITDLPASAPDAVDRAELARVLGVTMLVTDVTGRVALNADVPEIAGLAEYAPCPIIYVSASEENPIVGVHRATGGQALFVRAGAAIASSGAAEHIAAAAPLPPDQLPGVLAGLALLWAMGLLWEEGGGRRDG